MKSLIRLATLAATVASLLLLAAAPAAANEAAIRKALSERYPQLKIDEVRRSPVAGIWEVRYDGVDILYSDATGDHIFVSGALVETRTRTDLTEQRVEKLLAVAWDRLPLKDGITIRQGTGARKLAVFVDPNCGYCRRFERDLATVKDVTVHVFLIPILGPDSVAKSRDIWCARDPAVAWRRYMLEGVQPSKAAASCNVDALDRNLAFSRTHRINGTPAVFFEDGTRRPGAIPAEQIEASLVAATKK
ncbi:MAG: DsbC family protein [Rubrivivax sp.]|nr:DsbC family protein [Rubrivivax sp.]